MRTYISLTPKNPVHFYHWHRHSIPVTDPNLTKTAHIHSIYQAVQWERAVQFNVYINDVPAHTLLGACKNARECAHIVHQMNQAIRKLDPSFVKETHTLLNSYMKDYIGDLIKQRAVSDLTYKHHIISIILEHFTENKHHLVIGSDKYWCTQLDTTAHTPNKKTGSNAYIHVIYNLMDDETFVC